MILMSLLDSINMKIDEGAKIELHRFLVTTLTDTSFEEQDLNAAVNAIDKCATIANVDNMPCVYIDWRGIAALASEYMSEEELKSMDRSDWERIGAGVKAIMSKEIDGMFDRMAQVLKEQVLPAYRESR